MPTAVPTNVKLCADKLAAGPVPAPVKEITWGLPPELSCRLMDPVRTPEVVGVNVMDKLQLLAAATLPPQLSVSAKSPPATTEEIRSAELPMFCSVTLCAAVVVPTCVRANCNEVGRKVTAGLDCGPIFMMKLSLEPFKLP